MARNGTSLSGRQRKFVAAMLTASSIEEAAKTAGIGKTTAYRYLKDPAVESAIAGMAAAAFDQVARRGGRAMGKALDLLEEMVVDKDELSVTRLSAARTILDAGPKLREVTELAGRLAELEGRMGGGK